MKSTTIHIRNMCCQRCIEAVTDELQTLGLEVENVTLGKASFTIPDKLSLSQMEASLNKRGFVLIKDDEEILLEKIKTTILHLVHHLSEMEKTEFVFSSYLEEQINVPYRAISNIFSRHKPYTIEKYFILLKVEKTKDLIENSNFRFSEIAYSLGYKSLQHLSAQFKQLTGMTMKEYKKSGKKKRELIDRI